MSVCDHTPSPPQRCSSSPLAAVSSSQQAWPGSPLSSPPGFCPEFHLCARGSCSPRQPSAGGLDTRTHRQTAVRNESDSNVVFKKCYYEKELFALLACHASLSVMKSTCKIIRTILYVELYKLTLNRQTAQSPDIFFLVCASSLSFITQNERNTKSYRLISTHLNSAHAQSQTHARALLQHHSKPVKTGKLHVRPAFMKLDAVKSQINQ